MTKYRVNLVALATTSVDVEADSREEAIDEALEQAPTPAWNWPEMDQWGLPSESFPEFNKPEDDVEEID